MSEQKATSLGLLLKPICDPVDQGQGKNKGDINGDTFLNMEDTIFVLKTATGQSNNFLFKDADSNGDGRISLQEAIYSL